MAFLAGLLLTSMLMHGMNTSYNGLFDYLLISRVSKTVIKISFGKVHLPLSTYIAFLENEFALLFLVKRKNEIK